MADNQELITVDQTIKCGSMNPTVDNLILQHTDPNIIFDAALHNVANLCRSPFDCAISTRDSASTVSTRDSASTVSTRDSASTIPNLTYVRVEIPTITIAPDHIIPQLNQNNVEYQFQRNDPNLSRKYKIYSDGNDVGHVIILLKFVNQHYQLHFIKRCIQLVCNLGPLQLIQRGDRDYLRFGSKLPLIGNCRQKIITTQVEFHAAVVHRTLPSSCLLPKVAFRTDTTAFTTPTACSHTDATAFTTPTACSHTDATAFTTPTACSHTDATAFTTPTAYSRTDAPCSESGASTCPETNTSSNCHEPLSYYTYKLHCNSVHLLSKEYCICHDNYIRTIYGSGIIILELVKIGTVYYPKHAYYNNPDNLDLNQFFYADNFARKPTGAFPIILCNITIHTILEQIVEHYIGAYQPLSKHHPHFKSLGSNWSFDIDHSTHVTQDYKSIHKIELIEYGNASAIKRVRCTIPNTDIELITDFDEQLFNGWNVRTNGKIYEFAVHN